MALSHKADQPGDGRCLTVVKVMEAVHRGEIMGGVNPGTRERSGE